MSLRVLAPKFSDTELFCMFHSIQMILLHYMNIWYWMEKVLLIWVCKCVNWSWIGGCTSHLINIWPAILQVGGNRISLLAVDQQQQALQSEEYCVLSGLITTLLKLQQALEGHMRSCRNLDRANRTMNSYGNVRDWPAWHNSSSHPKSRDVVWVEYQDWRE